MSDAPRAAIYDRVSKDRKKNQRSVEDQEVTNHAACESHGWQVSGIYTDNDRSASRFATKDRPDWQRLLQDLESRDFEILVMWESSRGDRKLEMWAQMLNTCRTLGVLIYVTSHDRLYDVRKARDWRSLAEDGVDSAYESEKIRDRVLRTTARVARSGMPHGKLLYGYRREYDRATGALLRQVFDERPRAAIEGGCFVRVSGPLAVSWFNPAEVIRECARRLLAGEALYGIAQDLNRRGIPTPRKGPQGWRPGQVKGQVTNPGYIARRIHQGKDLGEATWPAILDVPTFNACVQRLTDPSRRTTRDRSVKYLLSGIATCGVCGERMRVVKNRGALSYSCWRRTPQSGPSFHVARVQGRLERYVVDVIIARLARDDATTIWSGDDEIDQTVRRLQDEAAAKRSRLEGFYTQAALGELSAAGLARIEQALLPEIENLERRMRSLHVVRLPLVGELVDPDHEVVRERWQALDMDRQREVIRALTDRIDVLPSGRGRRNYNDWEVTRIIWRGQSAQQPGVDVAREGV